MKKTWYPSTNYVRYSHMSTIWTWKAFNPQERNIYSIFTKVSHPHAYTFQSYQEHSWYITRAY
jgi:hypothetical protein